MRKWVWLFVGAVGLTAAGRSEAQFGLTANNGARTTVAGSGRPGTVAPTSFLGGTFRLGELFPRLNPFSTRNTVGQTTVPDPNSREYLQAFGYKRLR